jgi:hypothetical protein
LYNNNETDLSYLALVSPSSDTKQAEWVENIYDGDESEYTASLPPNSSLQRVGNPLTRDIDDLPDDVDDEGDDQVDGNFLYLLVSTLKDNEARSGDIITATTRTSP